MTDVPSPPRCWRWPGCWPPPATAAAGWDNVFQVCCHDCRPKPIRTFFRGRRLRPRRSRSRERRVEYQRSCYYEPVTVMKPERYTEAVPVQVRATSGSR